MGKTILVMIWVTVLATGLAIGWALFYAEQQEKAYAERDNHIKELGLACIHHVHNLSASGDANLKDFYSSKIENPEKLKAEATLQCLQEYPLYSGQESFSTFNTTLD